MSENRSEVRVLGGINAEDVLPLARGRNLAVQLVRDILGSFPFRFSFRRARGVGEGPREEEMNRMMVWAAPEEG